MKGFRTYIFFAATVALGIVDIVDPTLLSTALNLDATGKSWVIIGLGVGGVILRKITNTPAGKQK